MSQVACLLFFLGKSIAPAQPLNVRTRALLHPTSQMGFPELMKMSKIDFSRRANHNFISKKKKPFQSEPNKSELIPVSPRPCLSAFLWNLQELRLSFYPETNSPVEPASWQNENVLYISGQMAILKHTGAIRWTFHCFLEQREQFQSGKALARLHLQVNGRLQQSTGS